MKNKLNLILVALILCVTVFSAKAQTTTQISPSHLKAAEDMLIASNIQGQLSKAYDNVINTFGATVPEDKKPKFKEVMSAFLNKYMGWEAIKGDMAKIYAEELSEDELKQITQFYLTPVGKKLNSKLADLQLKGMTLGQKKVQDHQSELQEELEAAFKN